MPCFCARKWFLIRWKLFYKGRVFARWEKKKSKEANAYFTGRLIEPPWHLWYSLSNSGALLPADKNCLKTREGAVSDKIRDQPAPGRWQQFIFPCFVFGKWEWCEGEAMETGSFDQKVVVGGRRGRRVGRLGGWRTPRICWWDPVIVFQGRKTPAPWVLDQLVTSAWKQN